MTREILHPVLDDAVQFWTCDNGHRLLAALKVDAARGESRVEVYCEPGAIFEGPPHPDQRHCQRVYVVIAMKDAIKRCGSDVQAHARYLMEQIFDGMSAAVRAGAMKRRS